MEILFVCTHTIMTICLIGVIWMSTPDSGDDREMQSPVNSGHGFKIKVIQMVTSAIYSISAVYSAVFTNSI
jgi:hypothetical protein